MDNAAALGGERNISQALDRSYHILKMSARRESKKIVILLTTGGQKAAMISHDVTGHLHQAGVDIFVVLIQPEDVFYEILEEPEEDLFLFEDFEDLSNIQQPLAGKITDNPVKTGKCL